VHASGAALDTPPPCFGAPSRATLGKLPPRHSLLCLDASMPCTPQMAALKHADQHFKCAATKTAAGPTDTCSAEATEGNNVHAVIADQVRPVCPVM